MYKTSRWTSSIICVDFLLLRTTGAFWASVIAQSKQKIFLIIFKDICEILCIWFIAFRRRAALVWSSFWCQFLTDFSSFEFLFGDKNSCGPPRGLSFAAEQLAQCFCLLKLLCEARSPFWQWVQAWWTPAPWYYTCTSISSCKTFTRERETAHLA